MNYPAMTNREYRAKFGTSDEALRDRYENEVLDDDTLRKALASEFEAALDDRGITYKAGALERMLHDLTRLLSDDQFEDAGTKLECWPCYETWSEQQIEGAIEWARDSASGGAL